LTATRLIIALAALLLGIVARSQEAAPTEILISVHDQQLAVVRGGELVARYPVSTSKFGVGDARGSYKTPLGHLRICEKYGEDLAAGSVLKGRNATGEVLQVNAPGRDPIVTRILWLEGLEEQNQNAHCRAIYIHGTPEEKRIGQPVSWGCIRMRSRDVMALYGEVPIGTQVNIIPDKLPRIPKADASRGLLLVSRDTQKPTVAKPAPIASAPEQSTSSSPHVLNIPLSPRDSKDKTTVLQSMKGSILLSGLSRNPEATEDFPARQLSDQRAAEAQRRTQ
jgi:hypothetical protein